MKSVVLIFYTCLFVKIGLDYAHQGNLWIAASVGFAAFHCVMYAIQHLFLSAQVIKKLIPEVEKAMSKAEQELTGEDDEFERDVDGELIGICECEKCVAYRKEHQSGDKNSSN